MSNKHVNIKLRRGTAAEWVASNELLQLGEPGFEKDTKKLKIGDGITLWNDLPYITPDFINIVSSGGIADLTISQQNQIVEGTIVLTTDGIRWIYTGTGDKLNEASYVQLADISPAWIQITNKPASLVGLADIATTAIGDFILATGNNTYQVINFAESVDDRVGQLIIGGSGINIDYNDSLNTLTINSSNTIASDTFEPDGFVNQTDSFISFDNSSRQFSISPKSPATNYTIYNNGIKVIKNSIETITLPNITALYFIHFDKSNNALSSKTTPFDFNTDIPIAHIYYNSDDAKVVYFGEERHGIRMDASTHRYLHNVFGTQYINGLSISNYTTSGDGSNNSDATIAIGNGLIYDEDIEANIQHSNTPSNPFEQVLYPTANIPVYYKNGSNGYWTNTNANNYPVKTGTTIQYNLLNDGSWSSSNSDNPNNNRYIAYWICATTQENVPIISIMGQRIDSSLLQAQSNNSWGSLNLNGLPIVELRPLYRLIYDTKSSLSNTPKGFLVDILDIRGHIDTVTGLTQNDHGSLYGLADDDHYQYIHIDNARNINAIHTFTNGLNASGLINGTSGNFSSLTVNSTGVSLNGHNHIIADVSGLQNSLDLKLNSSEVNTDLVGGPGISLLYNNSNNTLSIFSNNENYITALGTLTGSNAINYDPSNRSIQTLTLNGTAVTFTKGTGWPTVSNVSVDTVLKITVTTATTITWSIVNDWFTQPPAGALSAGTHLFLLRAVGSSIIEGHYIGNKTN